ncbi:MAG: TetR/AcrR family transcriptional regulator [Treponema sp.]|jgi:AcrR family transcriptional regulator|nr:TetR/AcrR family transcriptional regulator [Treponema sp.]
MGIQERRGREKEARKTLIMDCAKELILKQGVEAVSMGDIAKKAELSKATLYLYFPSKEALFQELCDTSARRFIDRVQSQMNPGLSALEQIKLFWLSYLALYGISEDMLILLSLKQYITGAFLSIPVDEMEPAASAPPPASWLYGMIKRMISQGIAEGTFDPAAQPDIITRSIFSWFSYVVEHAAKLPQAARKSQDMIEAMKHIFEILLKGIAREGVDRSLLVLPERYWEDDGKLV